MTTGTHRKPSPASLPRIPVAYMVIGAILFVLAVALLVAISAVNTPHYAHALPWPGQLAQVMANDAQGIQTAG